MSSHEPAEDGLYQDPELAQFYDLENQWGPDLDCCLQLAKDAQSVLDLGCGTGQLAARLADSRIVVGIDPAEAMLEIARRRPGGQRVTWVRSDAQSIRLGRHFDLVLLTGHAFQVFLTREDQRAVLSTIAEHLAPGGRFIFDTRNPAAEEWRDWTPEHSGRCFEHPGLGTVKAWNDAVHDAATGIVTYQTHYQVVESGQYFSAPSEIRFTTRELIAAMLDDAGLEVDKWLGGWSGGLCKPTSSEIIPIGRLR
ncbi:MAG: class I SAM-dependent methyltransferase [Proteobacteria bacterium]|nr:class I SAM-dependent methyltransferase [Pseudomonadota bacterium]